MLETPQHDRRQLSGGPGGGISNAGVAKSLAARSAQLFRRGYPGSNWPRVFGGGILKRRNADDQQHTVAAIRADYQPSTWMRRRDRQ